VRAARAFCVALPMGFVYANPSLFSGRVEERPFIDVSKMPHLMRHT
jgi:hypothetical protein